MMTNDIRYELWQTGGPGGYKMLVGTYDTWDEAFVVAKQRNEECNGESDFWAENDCFIIVEEGLSPHKLKCALNYKGNIDFKEGRWIGTEKQWRRRWRK